MVIDQDELLRERFDRIEKLIEDMRHDMNEQVKQLRVEATALDARLSSEICVQSDSITRVRDMIVGNGSTGLSPRVKLLEVLVQQNAEAIKDLKDSIRYYFRWFLATGVVAVMTMLTDGIIEIIKMWSKVHG